MDLGIRGKWALVCGASKGLGLGCAQALSQEGANVVIVARGVSDLEQAADGLRAAAPGVSVIPVVADITTPEGRAAALSVPGGPDNAFDIVVTNAGGPPPGDFRGWDRDAWLKALEGLVLARTDLTSERLASRRDAWPESGGGPGSAPSLFADALAPHVPVRYVVDDGDG